MVIPGDLIAARYRLSHVLGQGGMGRVWAALDELLRREVAVKEILLPEEVGSREFMELCARAVREARAAALLDHESIITVHDVFIEQDRPWIVMELVRGSSLRQVLPLPAAEVARIGLHLLTALEFAHARGVLHRDVTPSNVLLAADGRVILTDFGLAFLDDGPALTRTGALIGTPGFIAPERLGGGQVDGRSDLFSLAATLYTAVEGRPPFDGLGTALTASPAQPVYAGQLGPLLGRMLNKDPDARPSTAYIEAELRRASGERAVRRLATRPPLPTTLWLTAVSLAAVWYLVFGG